MERCGVEVDVIPTKTGEFKGVQFKFKGGRYAISYPSGILIRTDEYRRLADFGSLPGDEKEWREVFNTINEMERS